MVNATTTSLNNGQLESQRYRVVPVSAQPDTIQKDFQKVSAFPLADDTLGGTVGTQGVTSSAMDGSTTQTNARTPAYFISIGPSQLS